MEQPDKFTKKQGTVDLEVECQLGLVELTLTSTHFSWDDDAVICLDLTARDCLELADMLRESAHYIMFNKHTRSST